ncbi:hypothetical protein BLA29_002267 [Euroglyphus maynei]|uniref:non-specific serine/threonine protein kinase n=1 Tax=Euroglyphus maynei TaxID=6958 RepID=A0A1Y3BWS4_EURMA|nr:hypothetical protein BLA29_002267 [Euroglyphus maynei]
MGCNCCKCCKGRQQQHQQQGDELVDDSYYIMDENGELIYIGPTTMSDEQQQQQQQQSPTSLSTESKQKQQQQQQEKSRKRSKKRESTKIQVDISRLPTSDVTPVLSCKSDGSDIEKILKRIGYRLEKEIGKGGYGTVYRAIDLRRNRRVACKVMTISADRKEQSLIKKELYIIRSIRHRYIIRVYKHFILQSSKNARVYIFMQYAERSDLWNYVRKKLKKGMRERQARRMFQQITSAIHYLHQRNIAHRDIKLENILLDRKYNCLITDFGLSIVVMKKDGRAMNAPNYCGTIPYMAPEIHLYLITKIIFDVLQADVWALGVVLYCMINQGKFPFSIDQDIMLQQQLNCQFEFSDNMSFKPDERLINLMTQIFQPNPLIRIRMVDLVNHPWLIDAPMDQHHVPKLANDEQKIRNEKPQQPRQPSPQSPLMMHQPHSPPLLSPQLPQQQQQQLKEFAEHIAKQNLKTMMMMMMNVDDKGKILEKQIPPAMMMMLPKKKRIKMKRKYKIKVKIKKIPRSPMIKMIYQPKSPFQQQSPQMMLPRFIHGKAMYPPSPMLMDNKNHQLQQQFLQYLQQQQQQHQSPVKSIATSTLSSDSDSD